jgi:hypothetical protein
LPTSSSRLSHLAQSLSFRRFVRSNWPTRAHMANRNHFPPSYHISPVRPNNERPISRRSIRGPPLLTAQRLRGGRAGRRPAELRMEERRSLLVATGGFATCLARQRVDSSDGRDDGKLYCSFVFAYFGIPARSGTEAKKKPPAGWGSQVGPIGSYPAWEEGTKGTRTIEEGSTARLLATREDRLSMRRG